MLDFDEGNYCSFLVFSFISSELKVDYWKNDLSHCCHTENLHKRCKVLDLGRGSTKRV